MNDGNSPSQYNIHQNMKNLENPSNINNQGNTSMDL